MLILLLGAGIVAFLWMTNQVEKDNLLYAVPRVADLPWLESQWTYFYLHLFTFLPVFALSFDRNVHYYRKWKYLGPAILPVGLFFIGWDVFFTVREVWGFNPDYLTGLTLFHLPVEEWLFFVTVPFACVFIYECLNFYVKKDWLAPLEPWLTPVLGLLFLVIGIWHWDRLYTATTFILAGGFLGYHYLFLDGAYRARFYFAYLVSLLPFLLVNGVLTGGYTREPVVLYNPDEYLGFRVTSVPLDDAVYGFLLLLGVTTFYEHLRKKV